MRKTMLGLVLAALMTAGLGSAAWAEPAPGGAVPGLRRGGSRCRK
mgnify:CR=1 FL=1